MLYFTDEVFRRLANQNRGQKKLNHVISSSCAARCVLDSDWVNDKCLVLP